VSSICAVLAETDVINMVSRGIAAPDILRGLHDSMAGRLARLLQSVGAEGIVFVTGGLSSDDGLVAAISRALEKVAPGARAIDIRRDPLSVYAGAIGAAIWGAFRHRKLAMGGLAWTKKRTA
jgi:benzoyl-CoA reductase subunit D